MICDYEFIIKCDVKLYQRWSKISVILFEEEYTEL